MVPELEWEADGYFDLPGLLEAAPGPLLSLIEAAAPLLQLAVGEDAQVICFQARVVPHGQAGEGDYGGWHRDAASPADAPGHPTLSASAKLFVPVTAHTPRNGCTGVVPATFHAAAGPSPDEQAGTTTPADCVRFEAPAAAGLLMDLRTWHSALPPATPSAGMRQTS